MFRIEDQGDEMARAFDNRIPGFFDHWKQNSAQKQNIGDEMFVKRFGHAPDQKIQFEFDEQSISIIGELWRSDIEYGKYSPPDPTTS